MSGPFSLQAETSALLVIDLQWRLMPAISGGETVLANTQRLLSAARILSIPTLLTEQNPRGLGSTVAALETFGAPVVEKMTFDATAAETFPTFPPAGATAVVVGCEAHVCVLQSVAGLLAAGCKVAVVADAIGSRAVSNRDAAIDRMRTHGAEIVTTEMVIFEWTATAGHPEFKSLIGLVKE